MNNLIIKRSQIVEAVINGTPAANVRYYFQNIPNLAANNLRLYGLEGFSTTQLATTPTGYTCVSTTTGIVVTLRDTNKVEFLYQMPFYTTIRANNYGAYTILSPRTINLTATAIPFHEAGTTETLPAGSALWSKPIWG